jgi:uncharacterized protein
LATRVRRKLEEQADAVPFHGWAHTEFVRNKAVEFATERGADVALVEAAALVHDLNYLVEPNSPPSAGCSMRAEILSECGFSDHEIGRIERIIEAAHIEYRQRHVDAETACLSDADSVYKILPITPVMFSRLYMDENRMKLGELAKKIVHEQVAKLNNDYYFYDQKLSDRYREWTELNLGLWAAILQALEDPDVAALAEPVPA